MSVSADGIALKFGDWGGGAGTARFDGDRLCVVQTTTSRCGSILRNPGGTKAKENEYIWWRPGAYTFSQIE